MKSTGTFTLTAVALVALAACKSSDGGGAPSASASASSAPSASAAAAGDEPLTLESYEKLLRALSSCKAVETETTYYGSVEAKCAAHEALNAATSKKGAMTGIVGKTAPLARKLLDDPAPAVRVQAAKMMESLLGTAKDNLDALVAHTKKEKDVAVLKAILHATWNEGAKHPEVGAMLISLAGHESPRVRATAAVGISSSWNKKMPGAVPKLIELIEKDADPKVKQAACEHAGELGDDALLPTYTKQLAPSADGALAGACFTGLMKMWASYPLFENQSEKAYKLSLKVLGQKRSEQMPPWTAMGTFENVGRGKGSAFDKWKAAATWYDAKAVKRALLEVAGDKATSSLARTGAVKAAVAVGATKAELGALKTKMADDKMLVGQIDRSMAEAK